MLGKGGDGTGNPSLRGRKRHIDATLSQSLENSNLLRRSSESVLNFIMSGTRSKQFIEFQIRSNPCLELTESLI